MGTIVADQAKTLLDTRRSAARDLQFGYRSATPDASFVVAGTNATLSFEVRPK